MKRILAGLCAGAFALALIGCGGESAPVKKPTTDGVKKKVDETEKKAPTTAPTTAPAPK